MCPVRSTSWIGLLVAAFLLVSGGSSAADPVDPTELSSRIAAGNAPYILDVRTPDEFRAGHIPGAVNVPHDQLAARLGKLAGLARDDEIVVHCESGRRAELAEATLSAAGYTHWRDLTGHMRGWREAGLPLELATQME